MPKIDKTQMTDFQNGQVVTEAGLEADFEILRIQHNLLDDEIKINKTSQDGIAARMTTAEADIDALEGRATELEKPIVSSRIVDKAITYEKLGMDLQASIGYEYEWVAVEGQTLFELPSDMTYPVGTKSTELVIGGLEQSSGAYTEASPSSIETTSAVPTGVKVKLKWRKGLMPTTSVGHQGTHQKGGADAIRIDTLDQYEELVGNKMDHILEETPTETLTIDTYDAVNNAITVYYVALGEFKKGKKVIIEGAGVGGVDLHTTIKSISTNSFLNYHTIYFTDTIVTDPTGKKIKHAPTVNDRLGNSSKRLLEYAIFVTDQKYQDIADADGEWGNAINTAITDCYNNGGGTVFVPAGQYATTTTIQLKDGVSVIGTESINNTVNSGTVINYVGTGTSIQCYTYSENVSLGNAETYSNIVVKGLFINDINNTGDIGLDLRGFRWCKLEKVSVLGFNKGLHTYHCYYATFKNLLFLNYRTNGIHSENSDNNTLWEKVKVGSAKTTGVQKAAIFAYAYNIHFINFDCEVNTTYGFSVENCKGVLVNGFYYEAGIAGLNSAIFLVSCKGTTIMGGSFQGYSFANRAVYNYGSDKTTIIGNWINGFLLNPLINVSIVAGDNRNFVTLNNQVDELNGDYNKIFTDGMGGSLLLGWRHLNFTAYDSAPPSGSWNQGDVVFKKTATAGSPLGWVCTVAGSPGTWVPFGQTGVMTSIVATPTYIGQTAIVGDIAYMATGTTSATDWKQITN